MDNKELILSELDKMCRQKNADIKKAEALMKQIDVNTEYVDPGWSRTITLLQAAAESANLEMAELLLNNNADPDFVFSKQCVLWDLQYDDGKTIEENENRLKIAQLLLEYGADPHIDPEKTGEGLFDYVVFEVFNDDCAWGYRARFLILLVAYGASSDYCSPRIVGSFDKKNMESYRFYLVASGKHGYSGVISDKDNAIVAFV